MHVQYGAAYIGSFGPWRVDPEFEPAGMGVRLPLTLSERPLASCSYIPFSLPKSTAMYFFQSPLVFKHHRDPRSVHERQAIAGVDR